MPEQLLHLCISSHVPVDTLLITKKKNNPVHLRLSLKSFKSQQLQSYSPAGLPSTVPHHKPTPRRSKIKQFPQCCGGLEFLYRACRLKQLRKLVAKKIADTLMLHARTQVHNMGFRSFNKWSEARTDLIHSYVCSHMMLRYKYTPVVLINNCSLFLGKAVDKEGLKIDKLLTYCFSFAYFWIIN